MDASKYLITAVNKGNVDIVKLLLENKVDVHWKDGFKTSAIMYAATKENIEIMKLLLKYGANINDHDAQGNFVLSTAKQSDNEVMISFVEKRIKEDK